MDGRMAAATLGVPAGATKDEIRRAFRALAKRVHPDVASSDSDTLDADSNGVDFVTLRAAFDTLIEAAPEARPASKARTRPAATAFSLHTRARSVVDTVDLSTSRTSRASARASDRSRAASGPNTPNFGAQAGEMFSQHLARALNAA